MGVRLAGLALVLPAAIGVRTASAQSSPQGADSARRAPALDVWNTGLAATAGPVEAGSRWLHVRVDERGQRQDLNGDGDKRDAVLFLVDPVAREVVSTGLAVRNLDPGRLKGIGELSALIVEERSQGADLNGDGDLDDEVLHVFDPRTGEVRNLGYSGIWFRGRDDVLVVGLQNQIRRDVVDFRSGATTTLRGEALELAGRKVCLRRNEQGQDLNGDGDSLDSVVQVLDVASGTTTNLALAAATALYRDEIAVDEGAFLFAVSESAQGMDLTGDGDRDDAVLFRHDTVTGTTQDLRLATVGFSSANDRFDSHWLVTIADEDGRIDWNRDGDRVDEVPLLVDARTGRIVDPWPMNTQDFVLDGERLASSVFEPQVGRDLDGDGVLQSAVAHVLDLSRQRFVNLKVPAYYAFALGPYGFAFGQYVPDDPYLDGAPDPRLVIGDPSTLAVQVLPHTVEDIYYDYGISYPQIAAVDGWIVYRTFEFAQGDLNGDGDALDSIVELVFDPGARGGGPTVYQSREAGTMPSASGPWALWQVNERLDGVDVNGDGDALDLVPRAYHGPDGTFFDLRAFTRATLAQGHLAVYADEAVAGDLNGDGDVNDLVLQFARVP